MACRLSAVESLIEWTLSMQLMAGDLIIVP